MRRGDERKREVRRAKGLEKLVKEDLVMIKHELYDHSGIIAVILGIAI